MNLTFASLMARALDEPDAIYPLAAAESERSRRTGWCSSSTCGRGIVFHDGTEIGAADVVFSLTTLKAKGHPAFSSVLRDVAEVVAEDKRTVRLRFQPTRGLDAPALAASMPIFSERYYATRSFDETSLEAPLGSGPYRVARFEQGRFVEFERVKNWWGANLPVSRGQYNFDLLRDEYYRDREAGFEAFTGQQLSVSGRIHLARLGDALRVSRNPRRPGQARRHPRRAALRRAGLAAQYQADKFRDRRVREAMTIAFDFEWTNKNLMYGSYQRTHSVFQNSEMMAKGEPSPAELTLLEPFRDRLLPESVRSEHGCRRRATGRGRIANCCAAPATCSMPQAGRSRTGAASMRAVSSSPSSSC